MKKLVIQENLYFNKNSWVESFNKNFKKIGDYFNITFVKTKNDLKKEILNSNICFCFEPNFYLDYNPTNLELVYLGISNLDYPEKYNFNNDILFYTAPSISSKMIAEYVLMMSMFLIKKMNISVNNQFKKKWDQSFLISNQKLLIKDYKIGVLGLGENGKEIVNLFNKLGCKVSGCSLTKKNNLVLENWYSRNQIDKLIEFSDILIVSLPLNDETKFLISKDDFVNLGVSSFIINISRGDILVESDLMYALNNNIISGAAIDVCSNEPLSRWSKLWKTNNLIITPHISGNINSFVSNVQKDFIEKIKLTSKK